MGRESSPEDGELEEGELPDEDRQISVPVAQTLPNVTTPKPEKSDRAKRPEDEKIQRSKREADKLQQLSQRLTMNRAKRDNSKYSLDLEECLDRIIRLSSAIEKVENSALAKNVKQIIGNVFDGLQNLHTVSRTSAGRGINRQSSAIRAVQQTDKHLNLFSVHQRKMFSSWCESKVFGNLLRGSEASSEESSEQSSSDTESESEEESPKRQEEFSQKNEIERRGYGQANDLASVPRPIQLPPPIPRPPVRPPPMGFPPINPGIRPPQPPSGIRPLIPPTGIRPPRPPPNIRPPPPLRPPHGIRPFQAPLGNRPPQQGVRPPLQGIRPPQPPPGSPPKSQRPQAPPGIFPKKDGPQLIPVLQKTRRKKAADRSRTEGKYMENGSRGEKRKKKSRSKRKPKYDSQLSQDEEEEGIKPSKRFQSFQLPSAKPKPKLTRPVNEAQTSSSSHSSDTSEDNVSQNLEHRASSSSSIPPPPPPLEDKYDPLASEENKAEESRGPKQDLSAILPSFLQPKIQPVHDESSGQNSQSQIGQAKGQKRKIFTEGLPTQSAVPGLDMEDRPIVKKEPQAKRQKIQNTEEKMSLEEEVLFFHGVPDPPPAPATKSSDKEVLQNRFQVPTSALPPGIDDDLEELSLYNQGAKKKPTRVQKRVIPKIEPEDFDFDAESDRLYGGHKSVQTSQRKVPSSKSVTPEPLSKSQSPQRITIKSEQEENIKPDVRTESDVQFQRDQNGHPIGLEISAPTKNESLPSNEPLSEAVFQHLRHGKLCLVLDLDHTLLNSARWGEVSPKDASKLEDMMAREEKMPPELKNLHSIDDIQMWTKLRPHCREFLRALSRKFVMWIHTNGNKQYAETVRAILDPDREYFGERVIANAGNSATNKLIVQDLIKKLDSQGLQGLDPITVIIDDTAAVWCDHVANLVVVERYCYFPSSTKQFNLHRPSMLESNRDERADQGQLAVIQKVLSQIHQDALQKFHISQSGQDRPIQEGDFKGYHEWDVRAILTQHRTQVLKGCRILFSRLWHVGVRNEEQQFWILARNLGASCTTEPDNSVTHLVTNTNLTEKARWAHQTGKKIVSPRWLEASSILWQRASEAGFELRG